MYTPLLNAGYSEENSAPCSPGVPSVAQIKRKAPTLFIPTLEYITVNEFDTVPKLVSRVLDLSHRRSSIQ